MAFVLPSFDAQLLVLKQGANHTTCMCVYLYVTILLKVRLIWQVCRVGSWTCVGDDPRIGEEDMATAGAGSDDSAPTSDRRECGACGFGIVSNAGSGSQGGTNDQHSGRVPGPGSCEFKHFNEHQRSASPTNSFFHSAGLLRLFHRLFCIQN